MKILVIEDSSHMQDMLSERLTAAGFQVVCADNGRIGLEMVQNCQPDLVLSDVKMPEMDGYEFVKVLRQTVDMATLPVVLLTGEMVPISLSQGRQLGINDYLTKPVEVSLLIHVVREQLARLGTCRMQSSPAESKPPATCFLQ